MHALRAQGGAARRSAAVVALLVFAVLGTAPPAAAQSAATLVSNMGQVANILVAVSTVDRAQAFTTGATGSKLSSVEIVSDDLDDDDMAVSVCTVDVDGYPASTSTCTALTPPRSFAAGTLVFTAPANTTLDANTTYTLLITSPGGESLQFGSTPRDREDTGGEAGWSIADESHRKSSVDNEWGPTITRLALRITIRGTTTATVRAPKVETKIPDQTATAGRAFSYAFPDNTFTDLDGDTLTYRATKADDATLPLWLTFTATTRTFGGTPQLADVGTVSVKVTASDGNGGSVSDTFDIVASPNNLPTASNGEVTASEDTDYTFTAANFNFSDSDTGDVLFSVKITSLPAAGTGTLKVDGTDIDAVDLPKEVTKVDIDARKLTYSPPANANGNDYATFQFKVNDGLDDSATASTMTIDVTAVNDAPVAATVIPDQAATAGTAFSYAFPDNTFSDADGDTLSYMATKADDDALPSWLTFTASTRTFFGTPQAADVETVSVKVTASDGKGGSGSDTFEIDVSASVPGAPTGLSATASGTTRINLFWTAPASNGGSAITGYKIESSSDGGSNWTDRVANTRETTTTYAHNGLTAGATRHYRVSAINTNGAGGSSNIANATTGTTVPGAPTGLSATASGTTQINLFWTAPASNGGSAITGYKIESSSDGGSNWTDRVANTSSSTTTYEHTGLAAGATRHYRVSAINTNGAGGSSNIANATTAISATSEGDNGGGGGGGGGGFGGGGGGGGGGPSGPSPSEVDFEWTVKHDIDALDGGHDTPSGQWSNGTTLWVLENGDGADDAIYAYDLESGERVEGREFDLDETNRAPRGVWSDRTVLWVSDSGRNRLFAHDLASGERLPERDIALAERNRAARGIWSDEEAMWVLDGGKDSLYAYDLGSGELLAEYTLDPANNEPHGVWSDGVTVWVSDDGAKQLFAYRLPTRPDAPAAEDEDPVPLERVDDEDFTKLSSSSNNSPRGIWSNGDFMYVADESDDKVYSYNMPDAIDARLSSLTLSGVDIGEFDPARTDYEGSIGEGVTETVVTAEAMQRRTDVAIDPPDADGNEANGYQVDLSSVSEVTITVTSADGSRTRVYRVALEAPPVELALTPAWTAIDWPGAGGVATAEAGLPDAVVAVYRWDEATAAWLAFFPGLEDVPGLNTLTTLSAGATYWVAVSESVTWTVVKRGAAQAAADRGP